MLIWIRWTMYKENKGPVEQWLNPHRYKHLDRKSNMTSPQTAWWETVTSCHRCPDRVNHRRSDSLALLHAPPPSAAVCCGCEWAWPRGSPGGRSGGGSPGSPGEGRSSRVTSPLGQRSVGTGGWSRPHTDAPPLGPAPGERGGRPVAPPTQRSQWHQWSEREGGGGGGRGVMGGWRRPTWQLLFTCHRWERERERERHYNSAEQLVSIQTLTSQNHLQTFNFSNTFIQL